MKIAFAVVIGGGLVATGARDVQDDFIHGLASEDYFEREEASRLLWEKGELATDDLREAARSSDPEMAMRARELLRKIDLGLRPDTNPRIIELTDRYAEAGRTQKSTIIHELRRLRAWRQILRLYANEEDQDTRDTLQRMVDGIALLAARESLTAGDEDGARGYLEMAGDAPGTLISLAAFHRAAGTLEAEMESLGEPSDEGERMWLNAMQRVAGNVEGAAESARKLGDMRVAAVMDMLRGDPLPWLEKAGADTDGGDYARAAAARWRGEKDIPELDRMRRRLRSPSDSVRLRGMAQLFLMGETEAAWRTFERQYPEDAYLNYDALERLDDALRVLGLDPENPDHAGYLMPILERVCQAPGDPDNAAADGGEDRDEKIRKLVAYCNFLERRGKGGVLDRVVMPALLDFGELHAPRFTDLMSELFATPSPRVGAPEFAMRVATEWAGGDEARWDEMLIAAFGEESGYMRWRNLMETAEPEAEHDELLGGMLALFGYTRDPDNERERWSELVWTLTEEGDAVDEAAWAMEFLSGNVTDLEMLERLRRFNQRRGVEVDAAYGDLLVGAVAGRWDEVADFFLAQIASLAERGDVRPEMHAYAAASLRNAGRHEDAEEQDTLAEALALGDTRTNRAVADAYEFGRDYERALKWHRRAVLEADPDGNRFSGVLQKLADELLEHREFAVAAACTEVLAQIEASENDLGITPLSYTRLRQQADLARALALPPERRDEASRTLRAAHAVMPTDGALADHFFPSILENGLTDVHDELFEISWGKFMHTLERFPESDNTMNTAGWFASRSVRRLDEAMEIQKRALELYPRSAAYLDTLAEIYFAKGNRAEAVRWGAEAVRYMPGDAMIIRQFERFLHAELPEG